MSAPQGEQLGGHAEQTGIPAAVIDPVLERRQEFEQTLLDSALAWAPGLPSTEWEYWPSRQAAETDQPRDFRPAAPGLVRIGHAEGTPVLIPVLGDGHLLVGSPELTAYIRPASTAHLPQTQQRGAAEVAQAKANQLNKRNNENLAHESVVAVTIARNMMVRTAVGMAPGAVKYTVYDPRDSGETFRDLGLMARHDPPLLEVKSSGELSTLLAELDADIKQMNGGGLRGYNTMRELAEAGEELPRPWRLVTLLKDTNRPLNRTDQERLDNILRQGAACGITLVLHGFRLETHDPNAKNQRSPLTRLHRLGLDKNEPTWSTTAIGDLPFTLDHPAPVTAARLAAAAAIEKDTDPAPAAPYDNDHFVTPGAQYRALIADRTRHVNHAAEQANAHYKEFPFLSPRLLEEHIIPSAEAYRQRANQAAAEPVLAAEAVAAAFDVEGTVFERMQAWALLQLLRNVPDVRGLRWTQVQYGSTARSTIEPNLASLSATVAVTRRHGAGHINELMRPFIEQYLPDEPPAWAFQLVADAATRPRLGRWPQIPAAMQAVETHLQATHGLKQRLIGPNGQFTDRELVHALIECELLYLYGYDTGSEALRNALVWRARHHLEQFDPDRLPPAARGMHTAFAERYDTIKPHEPQHRIRTVRGIGSALWRRGRPHEETAAPDNTPD